MGGPRSDSGDGIFISYRREDAAYPAGWLFDLLAAGFGADRVFKDVDSIQPGDDFVEEITVAVGSCAVLLAVIGKGWLGAVGDDGCRRLDDPADLVRLEIETALSRDVRVIPVLVDGAIMPVAGQLPASLGKLVRRQAVELSPLRFSADASRLLKILAKEVAGQGGPRANPPVAVPQRIPHLRVSPAARHEPVSREQRNDPDGVAAAVLARLETYGSPHAREAYDGLAEIGYLMLASVPRDPNGQPQSYLRIYDPNRPGPAVGYLTPQSISFTRDREQLRDEPGGKIVPSTGEVAFSHATPAGLARALQVASRLKCQALGQDV